MGLSNVDFGYEIHGMSRTMGAAPFSCTQTRPLTVPRRIPGSLDKAGLVVREKGKPLEHHYAMAGTTPYGNLSDNLLK